MPKIAVTQIDCAVGDVEANVSKACEMAGEAARAPFGSAT